MSKFKDLKIKTKKFYDNWRKQKTFCPALDCEIRVSRKGWDHLTGSKKTRRRNLDDSIQKFKLVPYAKKVIKSKQTKISSKKKVKGVINYCLEGKVNLSKKSLKKEVKVIIFEDKKGNKIFYSVMKSNK